MNKCNVLNDSIVVTGAAGFIGFHLSCKLIKEGFPVIGVDNINSYYDVSLKEARLKNLIKLSENLSVPFEFHKIDIANKENLEKIFLNSDHAQEYFDGKPPTKVVNLAAQAGVRYSLKNPSAYVKSNIFGFLNILECCKDFKIKHLVYASSSSVYGGNTNLPFCEKNSVEHPVSLYAATKKSNELMAHTYSHLFNLPTTGLRFFTVYGPWGRPDMALFLFTKAILNKESIKVFNNGNMIRDFTYIDDIVESLIRVINKPAFPNEEFDTNNPDPKSSWAPYRIFNIGNSNPVKLMDYIEAIENKLGIKAIKEMLPMQQGDLIETLSDNNNLAEWIDFKPNTSIKRGISLFIDWFKDFYNY